MKHSLNKVSSGARINLPLPTLGGQAFWTDRETQSGWRVQVNALTGHSRLLDRHNLRRGWGSHSAMLQQLHPSAPKPETRPRHAIVLIHGLGGNSLTFAKLRKILRADGHVVLDFKYASAMTQINAQADDLCQFVCSLGAERVTFVTQSMGGLVADRALCRATHSGNKTCIGRTAISAVIRIGTPSGGSAMARRIVTLVGAHRLRHTPLAEVGVGLPLRAPSDTIAHFNIAGSLNKGRGINPWISGADDGLVGVSEVRRDEPTLTIIVNASHYGLTSNRTAIDAIRSFLNRSENSSSTSRQGV